MPTSKDTAIFIFKKKKNISCIFTTWTISGCLTLPSS
uniref:Lipoprotein n=1 Tax=Anguilla anguilla TaxID=7936 RepID=A0A0E9W5Y5_ANGAN